MQRHHDAVSRKSSLSAPGGGKGQEPIAQKIIERAEAHYEVREIPFGKVYEWRPAYVAIEYDCGEQLSLTVTAITSACSCGARLGGIVYDLQEREGHLPDRLAHPWFYDAQARAQQRLRDEAAYPEDSPWRYDDVTADES